MRKRDFFEKSRGRQHHDLAARYINALRGIDDPEAWVSRVWRVLHSTKLAADWEVENARTPHGRHVSAEFRDEVDWCLKQLTPPPAPHGGGTSQEASGG